MFKHLIISSSLLLVLTHSVQASPCYTGNSCWTVSNKSNVDIAMTCTNPVGNFVVPLLEPGQRVSKQYNTGYGDGLGLWPIDGKCTVSIIDSDEKLTESFDTKWWGAKLFSTFTEASELNVTIVNNYGG